MFGKLGMLCAQLGRSLRKRAAGIVLEMPFLGHDIAQERIERPIVLDQALVEEPRVPVIKDVADVEDDGNRPAHLALAGLEAAIRLVDDIGAATAADHAVVAVTPLERLE